MIEIWRYQLQPLASLNATSPGLECCEGALVRIDGGYGCIHPWPSLGDAPIDEQLSLLAQNEPTALGRRALDCCHVDGTARREGRSLFAGLVVPRSHITVAAGEAATSLVSQAVAFSAGGFDTVKIKTGLNIGSEAERVRAFADAWRQLHPENKIRLDFNSCLTPGDFQCFVSMLPPETREMIDFVEDPCPYDPALWRMLQHETGLQLALDRGVEQHQSCDGFSVRVWKPACASPPIPSDSERLVVTSYMDHAIGQLFAAYEVARFPGKVDTCGLLTHTLFEDDPFFQSLSVKKTRLVSPAASGLGFGAMLEALPWKPLT